jgi:hypothetical protein
MLAATAMAQPKAATQPTSGSKLQVRALEEFNRGNYQAALPMLRTVADEVRDDPMRLGAIKEAIRVCEKNLAAAASGAPLPEAPPTAEQRKPHAPPQLGKVREMEIKDLGNFDYDADRGGNIPDDVIALGGSMVRLKGFMIPLDQAQNITEFVLVPSLFACCFGQPPTVQHTVIVRAPEGKGVSYYPDEIVVEGKLTVEEEKDDGFIVSIFEVDCTSVRPSEK